MATTRVLGAFAVLALALASGPVRAGPRPAARLRPTAAAADAAGGVRFLRRAGVPWATPDAAAREHLRAVRATGPERRGGADLVLAGVHDGGRGAVVVRYRDEVDGVPVFRGGVAVVMTRGRELVAVSGPPTRPARPASWGAAGAPFRLDREQAARAALLHLGVPVARDGVRPDAADGDRLVARGEGGRRPAGPLRARRVLYAADGRLVPAWHVEVAVSTSGEPGIEAYGLVVSADDGRLLFRNDRVRTAAFTYRVYGSHAGLPIASSPFCDAGIPHPTGVPDGYQPSTPCDQEAWSLSSYAGTDAWLPDSASDTAGNAVDAFFEMCVDANGQYFYYRPDALDPALGDFRAGTTGSRAFEYLYDPGATLADPSCTAGPGAGLAADPQLRAKIVQAFFTANVLHDVMRGHGFDEASGNTQDQNFGRGGLEHDALRVILGGSTWAATMSDGYPSVVSVGNGGTGYNRDTVFDLATYGHEWMHILQNRLIGDGDGLSNSQGGALGEGWSDFFGLLAEVRPGQELLPANADWGGAYAVGAYSNTGYCYPKPCQPAPPGEDQSWYFGIRRYPFTVDLSRSPLTFRWLENDVPRPAGIPTYTWKGRVDNAEGHNAGEIWATALWHCYRELLRDPRYDFATAQGRMLDYLVASMKATPVDPTFTDARDALLAVAAATDPTDLAHFEAAFAARGMGAGAVSPPRDSVELHGVVESFAPSGPGLALSGATLGDAGGGGDDDGVLDVGETGTLDVVLHDTGFQDLSSIEVQVSAPGLGGAPAAATGRAVARGGDLALRFQLPLAAASTYGELPVAIAFGDPAAGLPVRTETRTFRVSYDAHRTSRRDDAESDVTLRDWTVDGWVAGCGGGYTSREHAWRRVPAAGGFAYGAPAAVCPYDSTMSTGWFWVGPQGASVSFTASFAPPASGAWATWSAAAVSPEGSSLNRLDFWAAAPATTYVLSIPGAAAPRLVQLRFGVQADGGAGPGDPDLVVLDDVEVTGAAGAPFSVADPNGTAGPPRAAFRTSGVDRAITFADESAPGGAAIVTRAWAFGDGATSAEPSPTHAYAAAGEYWASLTVTDADGKEDVAVAPVRPELPLAPGVRYAQATQGTALFSVDVPDGATQLRVRATPGSQASVELIARHADPVVLPPLYSSSQPTAWADAVYGPPEAVITVAYPLPGRWHLATVGPSTGVVAEVASGGSAGPAPGGGCGCGAGEASDGAALAAALALLIAARRGRGATAAAARGSRS